MSLCVCVCVRCLFLVRKSSLYSVRFYSKPFAIFVYFLTFFLLVFLVAWKLVLYWDIQQCASCLRCTLTFTRRMRWHWIKTKAFEMLSVCVMWIWIFCFQFHYHKHGINISQHLFVQCHRFQWCFHSFCLTFEFISVGTASISVTETKTPAYSPIDVFILSKRCRLWIWYDPLP